MDRRSAMSWIGLGAVGAACRVGQGVDQPAEAWEGTILPWPVRSVKPTASRPSDDLAAVSQVIPGLVTTTHPVTTALAVAPSRQHFASGGDDHRIHLWQRKPPKVIGLLRGHRDWVRALLFVDDEHLVSASNDGTLRLWDRERDMARDTEGTVLRRATTPWTALAHSSSGGRWAAVSFSGRVEWYDARNNRRLGKIDLDTNDLRCAAFSPDARELTVAGRNGRLYRIDLDAALLIEARRLHHRRRRALAYLDDGRMITAGDDGVLCLVDRSRAGACRDVRVSRAGDHCLLRWDDHRVVVGASDNVIRMVDIEQGKTVAELKGHTGTVAALCRLDSMLLSGGYDTTIRLWTPKTAVARRPHGEWRPR